MKMKTALRHIDRYRRKKMAIFDPVLYKALSYDTYHQDTLIPVEQVQRILIVRNNKRIGNMFFLLPFVKQIRTAYPHAHITLLLSQSWQGQIFDGVGVDDIRYSNFSFGKAAAFFSEIKQLKKTVFDLIVAPYSSVEDSLISAMLAGKNKVSVAHAKRNSAFTHVFEKNTAETHSALHQLFLIEALTQQPLVYANHEMIFTEEELALGVKEKQVLCDNEFKVIAFFRGARGAKKLTDDKWRSILDTIQGLSPLPIRWIEILSPDIQQPLMPNGLTYQNSNMRRLGCFIKNVTAFISCDTGPLHLADAAGAKCIGLFTHTCPKKYGVLGEASINIDDVGSLEKRGELQQLFNESHIEIYRHDHR
ncbi:glycosyltransferase family 9 protein [Vibrio palustris]|uniref:Lipopolysaccharide core biosynthesis protein n=1 Tax=Vibrio palustris TaxID=1918946 RepID=A0A1R4B0X0_9VIBR|nr:glycosyltransferase family 9 protein [Vibrio palustris]SJL82554.1 lipopolysaccharide core biosynthesis protein [Vibrio palustris]